MSVPNIESGSNPIFKSIEPPITPSLWTDGDPFYYSLPGGKTMIGVFEEMDNNPDWEIKSEQEEEDQSAFNDIWISSSTGNCRRFEGVRKLPETLTWYCRMQEITFETDPEDMKDGKPPRPIYSENIDDDNIGMMRATTCPWDIEKQYTYLRIEDLQRVDIVIGKSELILESKNWLFDRSRLTERERKWDGVSYVHTIPAEEYKPSGGPSLYETYVGRTKNT
ncbi:hypothetical protein M231_03982 [Tremella mesenterica]|uniref:Uncharacterized protein n=1 Tax=Tremella mesenterica TaxID=5217 RepID=A0A4Q1BLY1_TREME|nr:hypothetical protein M231_03982 [Tremella mesenterica]